MKKRGSEKVSKRKREIEMANSVSCIRALYIKSDKPRMRGKKCLKCKNRG